ncbi:MAG: FAD-dependent oxidoreductase [Pseudomonadales bacterium]
MKSKSLQHVQVAIVGAGIAGLTAAIALRLKGLQVTVIERAASPESSGAGLQIQPCASRVVDALDLSEEFASIASAPSSLNFIEAHSGRLIIQGSPNNRHREFPHYQAHRADFHSMLLKRAGELGAELHFGRTVLGVNQGELEARTRPKLTFADSSALAADLVIGADGIKSLVSRSLFGEDNPTFTGQIAYRAMVDASQLDRKVTAAVVMGPKSHFVMYPLRDGRYINVVAQQDGDSCQDESWNTKGEVDDLRRHYSGWHTDVDQVLGAMKETYRWALYTRKPMPRWSIGPVGLIGDACHAALPNLGAGAAMAMEDAYLLAELIERHPTELSTALNKLYLLRIGRCSRVQRGSARNAKLFHISNPAQRWLTHRTLGFVSKNIPYLIEKQLTWLQDYDVTQVLPPIAKGAYVS